jgi:hypothetical protein
MPQRRGRRAQAGSERQRALAGAGAGTASPSGCVRALRAGGSRRGARDLPAAHLRRRRSPFRVSDHDAEETTCLGRLGGGAAPAISPRKQPSSVGDSASRTTSGAAAGGASARVKPFLKRIFSGRDAQAKKHFAGRRPAGSKTHRVLWTRRVRWTSQAEGPRGRRPIGSCGPAGSDGPRRPKARGVEDPSGPVDPQGPMDLAGRRPAGSKTSQNVLPELVFVG